ncbi:MAG: electron transfer flavoprotein subunit alpha/FixB family protein [Ornithinimicrobium sp.]
MSCLVFVESVDGAVSEVSTETLTFARALDGPVDALVVGDAGPLLGELGAYGVARVFQAGGEGFEAFAPSAWAAAVVAAVQAAGSSAVIAGGSPRGNEIMAHVAARQDVLMAANVVQIEQAAPLQVSRQVFGGAALEVMQLSDSLGVLSVAGHACAPAPADAATNPEVHDVSVSLSDHDLAVRVARTEAGVPDESGNLKSAKVVVGAGRGAGSADAFGELEDLTELLGASLGVSRVVTSLGWRPHHEQVGQTGSRISPDLYIPCGISGAIQHWAGCSSAKTILAINSDPDAPMVTRAHYAVIGDMHEIVPAINEEIRRRASV